MTMDYDCNDRQVVRKTYSGTLATISIPVPDFMRHLPEKSHHSIPTSSNVKTYVAGPHPSGVQALELEQFVLELIHGRRREWRGGGKPSAINHSE